MRVLGYHLKWENPDYSIKVWRGFTNSFKVTETDLNLEESNFTHQTGEIERFYAISSHYGKIRVEQLLKSYELRKYNINSTFKEYEATYIEKVMSFDSITQMNNFFKRIGLKIDLSMVKGLQNGNL